MSDDDDNKYKEVKQGNTDEEIPLRTEDPPERKNEGRTNGCRQKVWWKLLPSVPNLIIFVLAIVGVVIYLMSSDTTSSGNSSSIPYNDGSFEKMTAFNKLNYSCIHHTPTLFLHHLPDNIDSLCVPKYYAGAVPPNMSECKNTRTYIMDFCFCDSKSQCNIPGFNMTDTLLKMGCFACSKPTRCPCQNGGECQRCIPGDQHMRCDCKDGTSGRFCTKITKRLCHRIPHFDAVKKIENCETSNKVSCLAKNYTSDLVCELTGNYNGTANCSKKETGVTQQIIGNGNMRGTEEVNTSNVAHVLLFSLIAFVSFLMMIYSLISHFCKIQIDNLDCNGMVI